MHLVATMPVRNEAPLIGLSLRAALRWCDCVIVLDHASTDDTREIVIEVAEENPGRVGLLAESDPVWREMAHRQRMLEAARSEGATHIAIVDADEVLTGNFLPTIKDQIRQLPPGAAIQVGMFAMWRSHTAYRVDRSIWSNRWDLCLAFRDHPNLCWKASGGYDHHSRQPHASRVASRLYGAPGGVMHLQWVNWRRLVAKHALYKMTERVKYPQKSVGEIDRLYSLALNEASLEVKQCPADWWDAYKDLLHYADWSAEPWQEQECKRLWSAHGAEVFRGLNLFGVIEEAVAV